MHHLIAILVLYADRAGSKAWETISLECLSTMIIPKLLS